MTPMFCPLPYAGDHGVNLVDTAYIYGKGHFETVIGQAIDVESRRWEGLRRAFGASPNSIRAEHGSHLSQRP
jgi:aryl-alcohol dehydrogenase-like predicted oxidoreductase